MSGAYSCKTLHLLITGLSGEEWLLHWASPRLLPLLKTSQRGHQEPTYLGYGGVCHGSLAVPSPSTEDRIIHGLQVVVGPSPERHHQRVSPKSTPLLTFGTSSSHGISWHPQPFAHPVARLQDFQGCTARMLQGWKLRSRLLQNPCSHPALLECLNHDQTLACACLCLPLRPGMQHHGNSTLVTHLLHLLQGC
jgi:hypothetical protein